MLMVPHPKLNKKGQLNRILNLRGVVFIFGGIILGFMLFRTVEAAIIGGVIGGIVSALIR
ncbi:MAG: hypothetical protein ABIH63_02960 [archaeon]